jgi:DNA-binding response OmpR family regulator
MLRAIRADSLFAKVDGMADLSGKTILIVDDDPDVVTALQMTLEDQGARIVAAVDGAQAVDFAEKENPDLIILDMMLPKRSGFLVLERIRNRKPKPRIIMITGNLGSRHKTYAESLGVDDYINKPFRMDRLLTSIEKLLGPADGGTPEAPPAPTT